jgi:hypothetical protein
MTMDTRNHVGVQSSEGLRSEPDIVVSSSLPPRPPAPPTLIDSPRAARLPLAIIAILVLLVSAVGIAIAAVVEGNSDSVAKPQAQQPAAVPAPPAALSVVADGPASVTVGEQATITVTYSDGNGIFSGTSEEWGDGVGASSVREGRCSATAAVPGALSDSYQLTHRWTVPGTYSLVLGVHTYTCSGTTAVQEQKTTMLIVKVLAR